MCLAGLYCAECAIVARSRFLFMVATKYIELCDFWIYGWCFGQAVIWTTMFLKYSFWSRYRIEWIKGCGLTYLIFSNRCLQKLCLNIMCVSFCTQCIFGDPSRFGIGDMLQINFLLMRSRVKVKVTLTNSCCTHTYLMILAEKNIGQ